MRKMLRRGWRWLDRSLFPLTCGFGVIALIFGLLTASEIFNLRFPVQMGTLPDWFSGVGGIATVLTLIVAWAVYHHDVKSRRADESDRRAAADREQAELITAWIRHDQRHPREVLIQLMNSSHGVAYDLRVVINLKPRKEPTPGQLVQQLGRQDLQSAFGFSPVLPPGNWVSTLTIPDQTVVADSVEIYFRDQREMDWRRTAVGRLVRSDTSPFGPPPQDGSWLAELQRGLAVTLHNPPVQELKLTLAGG